MRITSLKVFVDLAQSGSFGEAAERNGISQPAVSQQICGLEQEFAAPLVERSRRRFRLTAAGQALFATAQKVLHEIESLKLQMHEINDLPRGELHVATTPMLGVEWLPRVTAGIRARFPEMMVQPLYTSASRVAAEVAGNVADFAILSCPEPDARFETITLAEERLCFVASPQVGGPANHQALARARFVAFAPDHATLNRVRSALQEHGLSFDSLLQFEHPEMVFKAMEVTNGFSCLPRTPIVLDKIASGELVELRNGLPLVTRQIGAVFLKQRLHLPAIRAVFEFLRGSCGSWQQAEPEPQLSAA